MKSILKSVKSLGEIQRFQNPYTFLGVGDPLHVHLLLGPASINISFSLLKITNNTLCFCGNYHLIHQRIQGCLDTIAVL